MLAFEVNQWGTVFHETMSDSGSSLRLACLVGLDAVEDALGHLGFDREVGEGSTEGHETLDHGIGLVDMLDEVRSSL
jgi:hypothetical protein